MIYLDHAATTPVDPAVFEAMSPYFCELYYNPSSNHQGGLMVRGAVDAARERIKTLIHCCDGELRFTSGASEANNLAIKGVAECMEGSAHFITSPIEHKAVLAPLARLSEWGHDVTILPVDAYGRVDPDDLRRSIRPNTVFCSIMHVNNETGITQDIATIGRICRDHEVIFHCDATQSFGKMPIDANDFDLMSVSAHKFYGPKGIGALYQNLRTPVVCQIDGGSQEDGIRAGTHNVPGIIGMGRAATIAYDQMDKGLHLRPGQLCNALVGHLIDSGLAVLNANCPQRAPWIANVSFPGVESEALMKSLGDILVSKSSACSKSTQPSHVLSAMGIHPEYQRSALRFSPGRFTTYDEIVEAAHRIVDVAWRLRQ